MNPSLGSRLFRADELTRRRFAADAARRLLGVGLLPSFFGPQLVAAVAGEIPTATARPALAKKVIFLFMSGGQSHLDTWDPKEVRDIAGPVKPIATSATGIRISEYLPLTAKQMHLATLVRSMTSTQGAHEQGNYFLHTSYFLLGTIRHPGLGAWANYFQTGGNLTLPDYFFIGNDSRHPGAGFLPAAHGPLMVSNPEKGVQNVRLTDGLNDERFAQRMALAAELDREFRAAFAHRGVRSYAEMYDGAVTLMKSADLDAFNLKDEPNAVRDAYGREPFGQGCLLARRLVERGVRFVEVGLNGWDSHVANFVKTPETCDVLDQALASLLADLSTRGLLKDTLVVLASEFGRTPEINQNTGRDHHPKAFSALIAGGGVKQGFVYGRTDAEGREIEEGTVEIPDLNATIAYALGLPLEKVTHSPDKRPFTIADKGKPVTALFA